MQPRGLGLRRLVGGASRISAASLAASVLAMAAGFVVARWVEPDRFGQAQTIVLAYFLASLVRSGIYEGSIRASINRMSRGDEAGARHAIDVGVTVETLVSLVPGLLLALGVVLTQDSLLRVGLIAAPAAVVLASVSSYLAGVHLAAKRFNYVARVALVRAVMYPAALLVLVRVVGAAGIFLAPIVADGTVVIAYVFGHPRTEVRPTRDWSGGWALTRVGFPMGLSAMVYWIYRTVGNTSVAWGADAATYGFYAFAAAPVAIIARLVTSMHTVLMPSLWEEMALGETQREWVRDSARVTVALGLAAGAITNVSQAVFPIAVAAIVDSYSESSRFFEILALNVFLLSVAVVPALVLDSEPVNRQVQHLAIWGVALAMNITANALAFAFTSNGPLLVAWNDIWIQALVVIAVFAAARPHLGRGWSDHRAEHALVATAAVTGMCALALHWLGTPNGEGVGRLLVLGSLRVAGVLAVWVVVTALLRGKVMSSRAPA